ncbi:MAG: hypothetical protein P8P83_02260 [Rickettsiaceae bacterium]|nr:hypothetical protein [Rickettsiaceae bacterium]
MDKKKFLATIFAASMLSCSSVQADAIVKCKVTDENGKDAWLIVEEGTCDNVLKGYIQQ